MGRRSLEEQVLCNGVTLEEEEEDDDDVWSTPGGAQGLFPIVIKDHSGNYKQWCDQTKVCNVQGKYPFTISSFSFNKLVLDLKNL